MPYDGKEKRRKIRVDFTTQVIVKSATSEIQAKGSSKDLSLKGIFVNTSENIPIGEKCRVKVVLTGMVDDLVLQMEGTVVRKSEGGLAVDFSSMDIDSYTHLKNIVKYNAESPHNPDDVY